MSLPSGRGVRISVEQVARIDDAVSAAHGPLLRRAPGEADARAPVAQAAPPEIPLARAALARAGEGVGALEAADRIRLLGVPGGDAVGRLHGGRLIFPAEPQVQGEPRADLEIVLEEHRVVVPPTARAGQVRQRGIVHDAQQVARERIAGLVAGERLARDGGAARREVELRALSTGRVLRWLRRKSKPVRMKWRPREKLTVSMKPQPSCATTLVLRFARVRQADERPAAPVHDRDSRSGEALDAEFLGAVDFRMHRPHRVDQRG